MDHFNTLQLLSKQLLLNVKLNEVTSVEEQMLARLSSSEFQDQLNTDNKKKPFWINIYNAYFQILSQRPKMAGKTIFTKRIIIIAQKQFSLDDIEHGILRKFRWKWSFGYLSRPFVPKLIRHLAIKQLDYRIHFALNCGATSCPPIAFYTIEKIENQLEDSLFFLLLHQKPLLILPARRLLLQNCYIGIEAILEERRELKK